MPVKSKDISFFFNPVSIAIIGASPKPEKLSYTILENLNKVGFPGNIYPVNPKYPSINNLKCYNSLTEIDDDIDVAVIVVPAPRVLDSLKDAGKKVKGVIIVSGGFKEMGDEGRRLEEGIKEVVEKDGLRVMGPNCLGIYDTTSRVDTFFLRRERIARPLRGDISLVSQSGSFASTIMDELSSEGIGVARIINYGNKVDIGESDCLEFLADDGATKVVALYIESIDDGRRFVDAASRCAKKKPVISIKVGKKESGAYAARSHTGAIAGKYEIYRAAFKKAGIIEVYGYEGFIDACRTLSVYSLVKGRRVLIITDGGGIGVSIVDVCEDYGLEVTGIREDTKRRLASKLPPFCTIGNPIDLTGSVTDEDYITALEGAAMDGFDIAILAILWGPPKLTEGLVDKLKRIMSQSHIPIILCSPGGEFTRKMNQIFERNGIPVFSAPEDAAMAAAVLTGQRI